jgi:ribosomal protein L24
MRLRSWVRIRAAGTYNGDLAYVVGSSKTTSVMVVAVVPRLPSAAPIRDAKSSGPPAKRQRKCRDERALFDLDRIVRIFGSNAVRTRTVGPSGFLGGRIPGVDLVIAADDFDVLPHPEWEEGPHREAYEFRGALYWRGLDFLPFHAYNDLEPSTTYRAADIIPFAESLIDPGPIDALLSRLHWQEGDLVRHIKYNTEYRIVDVQAAIGTVILSNEKGIAPLLISEVRRHFKLGDELVVLAGRHKGETGQVVFAATDSVTIVTGRDGTHVRQRCRILFLSRLTPPSCQISVSSGWVASKLLSTTGLGAIKVGDHVKVVYGRAWSGRVVEVAEGGSSLYVREHGTDKLVSSTSLSAPVTHNIL